MSGHCFDCGFDINKQSMQELKDIINSWDERARRILVELEEMGNGH